MAGRMKAYFLVEYVGREQECAAKTLQTCKGNLSKWLQWMREEGHADVRQEVANVAKENTPAFAFD
jgi:translation elongation factor EF-Ts